MRHLGDLLGGELSLYEHEGLTTVFIKAGVYKGVLIAYGEVRLGKKLRFDYEIINPGPHIPALLRRDKNFAKTIGDVLRYLMVIETMNPRDLAESSWADFSLSEPTD